MAIQAQLCAENLGVTKGVVCEDWVDNGFDFSAYNLQNPQDFVQKNQLLQGMQQQQQSFPNQCLPNEFLRPQNIRRFCPQKKMVPFSNVLAAQMEKQKQEIDFLISLQNEKLRLALQQQQRLQVATILRHYEAKAGVLLRLKDEEIAKAIQKKMELEDLLQKIEVENQSWQQMAIENEAMVASLNNTIQQLRESPNCSSSKAENAESCCDDGKNRAKTGDGNRGICKACNSWDSCYVFLPCRHLCSCKNCEGLLDFCPVCGMVKEDSIQVLV